MVSNAFFVQRLNDHIQYLMKVQAAIEGKDIFDSTDPHHCKLGEWLYGTGSEEVISIGSEAKIIFDDLFEPHERFHVVSTRALEKYAAGNNEGCRHEMTEMHILSGKLIEILLKLDQLSRKNASN